MKIIKILKLLILTAGSILLISIGAFNINSITGLTKYSILVYFSLALPCFSILYYLYVHYGKEKPAFYNAKHHKEYIRQKRRQLDLKNELKSLAEQ